jgi:hypothetical protein
MTQTLEQAPVADLDGTAASLQNEAGDAPRDGGRARGIGRGASGGAAVAGLVIALAAAAASAAYLTFPHAAVFHAVPRSAGSAAVPVIALAAVIAAIAAWRAARRLLRNTKGADGLTKLAAIVAMSVSATGMWAFFTRFVPGIDAYGRVPIFAFLELATFAFALRARDNMRDFGSSGLDGNLMWVLTGVNSFLASLASTSIAEALFRLTPPVVAALLWERGLVSERRRSRPRKENEGITWRVSPRRLLVRLGLADPGEETVGEAAIRRRITSLALAAGRAASLDAAGVTDGRRYQRADRRLRKAMFAAIEHTDLASSPQLQQQLLSQVLMLRSPRDLVSVNAASPWARIGGGDQDERRRGRRQPGSDRRDRTEDDQRKDQDRRGGQDGGPDGQQDDSPAGQLIDELSQAWRRRDFSRTHELLAGRADYADLAGRLAGATWFGGKRVLLLTALYAQPDAIQSPARAVAWLAGVAPGKQIEKKEIREVREAMAATWEAAGFPGPAAGAPAGPGQQDSEAA